jgi:hypothetical protein
LTLFCHVVFIERDALFTHTQREWSRTVQETDHERFNCVDFAFVWPVKKFPCQGDAKSGTQEEGRRLTGGSLRWRGRRYAQ